MKRFAALLVIFVMMATPAGASNTPNLNLNTGSFTEYLNTSQYSGQVSQITNLTSQYQSSMNQYNNYIDQYDNLVGQWNAAGKPANQQNAYMQQGQALLSQASSSYNAAGNYANQINGMVSGLQGSLGSAFSGANSITQLTSSITNLSGITGQLSSMTSQLSSLQSLTSGNLGMNAQIGGMQNYINGITGQISSLQSNLTSVVNGYASGLNVNANLSGIMNGMNSITGMVSGLQSQVTGMAQGALSGLGGQLSGYTSSLTNSMSGITGTVNNLAGQATGAVSGLTNQLGSSLSNSLNSMTGMNGENGSFTNSGSGEGGSGGSGGAALSQPAQQVRSVAGDFGTTGTTGSSSGSSGGEPPEEDFEGFIPDDDPDVYWVKDEEGGNAKPTCDEIRGSYGNTPITVNGACANSAYRIGYTGADMSKYFMKAVKQQDGSASYKGDSVGYAVKGNDGASTAMKMGEVYIGAYGLPKTFLNNWGKASGEDVLIKKTDMSSAASTETADGYYEEEEKKKVFDAKTGKQREYFSTTYKDNEDAVESGACQLVAVKSGGKYQVKPLTNGTYEMVSSGGGGSDTMAVVPERIVNARHPYAPRDDADWTEKTLLSLYEDPESSTNTCGEQKLLANKKAWENMAPGGMTVTGSDSDGNTGTFSASDATGFINGVGGGESVVDPQGLMADYEYYKLPLEKDGKILTTTPKQIAYDGLYTVIYEACNIATYNAAQEQCDNLAKLISCRVIILPPIKPENYLKMSYNKQDAGSELPWIYESTGDDFGYPDTTGSNVDSWAEGYIGLGTSWHQILPHENFGYNMPPLKHWPTGKPASIPLLKETPAYPGKKSKEKWATNKWEYWRTTITGVNSRFKPDESNPEETGVQKFGAMFGEWNELIMYQANCNRFFGLNCICDYFKNFYKGSAMGYAMGRASGQVAMGNESHNEYTDVQTEQLGAAYDQYKYKKNAEKSDVSTWERILNVKKGNQNYPAIIGKKIASSPGGEPDANWPGNGAYLQTGLDNAQVGDIIIWDSNQAVAGGHKRPLHAAYVERTMNKESGGKCIQISESNNGVIRDAAGNTENWGRVTTRWMCNQDDPNYTFNQEGKQGLKDCSNMQMSTCWEKQWNQWKIYRYKEDTQRITDPKTGEVKDGSDCQSDTQKFIQNQDMIKSTQTGGWEQQLRDSDGKIDESKKDPKIQENKDLLKTLTDKGCPPPVKYQLKDRNLRGSGITTGQYIPTAPNEPVSLFDFIYNVNLGSIFGDLADLIKKFGGAVPRPQINPNPPQITFKHNTPPSSGGSSGSSGGETPETPAKTCGQIAVDFADIVKNTSGVTYKDGCAGNAPVAGSSATCNGKEFGRFGLIHAAYNNDKQEENVNGLWNTAPAHASTVGTSVVAYNNRFDNQINEPNGCRLTNLRSCAKAGDIVLVQSGSGLNRLSPYNRFLIYDGSSKFFEVQESGQTIRYGSLPPEYANASYEVRHLSCNE